MIKWLEHVNWDTDPDAFTDCVNKLSMVLIVWGSFVMLRWAFRKVKKL